MKAYHTSRLIKKKVNREKRNLFEPTETDILKLTRCCNCKKRIW